MSRVVKKITCYLFILRIYLSRFIKATFQEGEFGNFKSKFYLKILDLYLKTRYYIKNNNIKLKISIIKRILHKFIELQYQNYLQVTIKQRKEGCAFLKNISFTNMIIAM